MHFWRPVTSLSIPDQQTALRQIDQLKSSGATISVITGLKFGYNLARTFRSNEGHALHEFFNDRVAQHHLKNEILEPDVQAAVLSAANESSYPVYLHTSCTVSSVLARPDYNATFRKPHLEAKCLASTCLPAQRERCTNFRANLSLPSKQMIQHVASYLNISFDAVSYSERRETIFVDRVLTQEEQTYLTQATSFPVRGKDLVPTLEWIGSINR